MIHLNFQSMELTALHYNSGQLFQRSNIVHVFSVRTEKINITSERRTKVAVTWQLETLRERWLLVCSTRQEQYLQRHLRNRQVAHTKTVATVPAILQLFLKHGDALHCLRFLALLCRPNVSNLFSLPALNKYFFNEPQWFVLECITSTWFFLDFHVALPKRPDLGNTSTNPLPIYWWCWCRRSIAVSQSKPTGVRFPRVSHLCYITPPIEHLVVAISHLIVALSHLFLGISQKICVL